LTTVSQKPGTLSRLIRGKKRRALSWGGEGEDDWRMNILGFTCYSVKDDLGEKRVGTTPEKGSNWGRE